MKNILSLIFFIFLFVFITNAQPTIQWQKSFGGSNHESANFIQQTADGGYIVAGGSKANDGDVTGNHGDYDFWILKLNSNGNIQWKKSLGGMQPDIAYSIQQTIDAGYVIAGSSQSNNGDVTGHHGVSYDDFWVVKLDSLGGIEWQKSLGGTASEVAQSIKQTFDGGYILIGNSKSIDNDVSGNHGGYDYWVVKLNSLGIIQWQKSLGGSGADFGYSINQTSDSGYIVSGKSNSTNGDVTGNHDYNDYWILKLNSSGIIQWQNSYGGTGDDYANSIIQTTDGGYIIAGESSSSDGDITGHHGSFDFWILKLDNAGVLQWQKSIGGTGPDQAYSIQQTIEGGFVVAGISSSTDGDLTVNHGAGDYWIVKLNDSGTIEWQKSLGGIYADWAYSVQQTSDAGFIIAGSSVSNNGDVTGNHGLSDYWIVKLNPVITGVDESSIENQIKIYPNPASSELTIISSQQSINTIKVFDLMGREIYQSTNNLKSKIINLKSFSPGVYFIKLQLHDGSWEARRFVKE